MRSTALGEGGILRGATGPTVLLASLAGLLGALDTALNAAFPDLADGLDIPVGSVQWLVISYVLSYGLMLIPAGRLADRVGHVEVLASGLVVSACGFLATGLAPSYSVLLVARVLQGLGIALVLGAAPALVTRSAEPERRGRALGVFQMVTAFGAVLGPLAGGVLVGVAGGWRAVFLFRVPLALGLLMLALRVRTRRSGAELATDDVATLDLGLVRAPTFLTANLLSIIANGSAFAIWLLVPFYVADILDAGPAVGGVVLTVVSLTSALSSLVAGRLSDRIGVGVVSTVGLVFEVFGLGALSRLSADASIPLLVLGLAPVGIGLGLFTVANMSFVMGSIPREHQGFAGSVTQMMRTCGIVGGVSIASWFFDTRRAAYGADQATIDLDLTEIWMPAFRDVFLASAIAASTAVALSLLRPKPPPT